AMKAPSAPIQGAKNGYAEPAREAAPSASVIGMLCRPEAFRFGPELMKTRTSGSANSRAMPAPSNWLLATRQDALMCVNVILWIRYVEKITRRTTNPGEYSY